MSRKPPKEFSEQEIAQITELFNEFKEAYDVIGCIVERLDVKRPKKRIIDKIVELGLVEDRRELRKKKRKKSNAHDSGEDEILDTDSDSSDSDKENRPSSTTNSQSVSHFLSAADVMCYAKEAINSGMKEAVDWIVSSLQDVIEDIGDDESDVPLLPLADYSVQAMDERVFQNLLLALGIKRPDDSQEMYWRIPGTWQANDLRKRMSLIATATRDDGLPDVILDNSVQENGINNDYSSRLENEDASDLDASRHLTPPELARGDPNVSANTKTTQSAAVKTKKKRFNADEFKTKKTVTKKRRTQRIADSDDSNPGLDGRNETSRYAPPSSSESDREEASRPSKKHLLSSDDSNDEHGFRVKKRAFRSFSSSDEAGEPRRVQSTSAPVTDENGAVTPGDESDNNDSSSKGSQSTILSRRTSKSKKSSKNSSFSNDSSGDDQPKSSSPRGSAPSRRKSKKSGKLLRSSSSSSSDRDETALNRKSPPHLNHSTSSSSDSE